jgi:hypothetical protein
MRTLWPGNHVSARRLPQQYLGAALALVCALSAISCAVVRPRKGAQSADVSEAVAALERKLCLTIGPRRYNSADQCEPQIDRTTYVQPLLDVFLAGPPIFRAYLCSLDRIYLDAEVNWNADWRVTTDQLAHSEYRTIGIRRGLLERKVNYLDWASGWTQHWWTGAAIDRPGSDPTLPRVESDLRRTRDVLFQLLAHEVAHVLDYDYRIVLRREPLNKPFEPEEFGFLSWISPRYSDSSGLHRAVAREPAVESVRTIDFDGNNGARVALRTAMEKQRKAWDAGVYEIANWRPAPGEGISTFLEQLDHSSFTTVFSTWRPEDDWTESFAMMMLATIATRFDIITTDGGRIRVLQKVSDATSPFAPKRKFIQQIIDRALTDLRARDVAAPNVCLAAALHLRP